MNATQHTPVPALPAATVALVREAALGPEVLMVQRNLKSGFVPGAYLFPGGALDAEDDTAEVRALCAGITDEEASRRLGITAGGLAYWAAAIRESFEEAGVLITYDENRQLTALAAPPVIDRFERHRQALNAGTARMAAIIAGEQLVYAVDQLVYFSHWITPLHVPRRYDTRFFVGMAPPAQVPLHDNQELIGHLWIRPQEALTRHRQGDFKMRTPTLAVLEEFAQYATAVSLLAAMRAKRDVPAILPRMNREGTRLLPGEPGYAELVDREDDGTWKT